MRIVLDLQGAQTGSRFRGIGRYSLSFAKALIRNASNHDIWIVLNGCLPEAIHDITEEFKSLIPKDHIRIFDLPNSFMPAHITRAWRVRAAEYIRESFLCELNPDIIHVSSLFEGWTNNAVSSVGLIKNNVPTAVTFYDLIPLLKKEIYLSMPGIEEWYSQKLVSLRRCNLLLAISDYSRQEAINILKIDAAKIVTISAAATPDIFRPMKLSDTEILSLRTRYKINRPYIMYNGGIEGRKNVDGLLLAFALLPLEIQSSYDLVIVGKSSKQDKTRLKKLASKKNITDRVIITDYIHDVDLVALYNQCALFVFPSLLEGFGLPPLEAMTCGAPTIGSNTTSIPEVIGFTDALFDPTSPQLIADKIAKVLSDKHFQQTLRLHAIEQAKKFSWDISAKKAITAFEECHHSISPKKLNKSQDKNYEALIKKIADLPRNRKVPTESDYIAISQVIANNKEQIAHD